MGRAAVRDQLLQRIGVATQDTGFVQTRVEKTEDYFGWCLDHLIFTATTGEDIPALFLRPPDGHDPVPAVIYAHAHGNRYATGSTELINGRPALQGPYGPDLRRLGVAALCLDLPAFGARQTPPEGARAKALLWQGQTLFGQMLAELQAGVDFLATYDGITAHRIGALGFSMGSTLAWWLAALDPRICATSALCSFADLEDLVLNGPHDKHGIYMMVPGLISVARSGQIAGLTAPRALQICVGLQDWSTPKDAFAKGREDLEAAFGDADALERLRFHVEPDTGHQESPEMRQAVLNFLEEVL